MHATHTGIDILQFTTRNPAIANIGHLTTLFTILQKAEQKRHQHCDNMFHQGT
jgi:hypothetical protein